MFAPSCIGAFESFAPYPEPSLAYDQNKQLDRNVDGLFSCGEIAATFLGFANQAKRGDPIPVVMTEAPAERQSPIVGLLVAAGMVCLTVAMEKT